ncbi:hypothetical protein BO82DRAFT_29062 [Aspergillus uvarum CBS 121591]|uniref:Uncharacterized protein n=1 Tax=Aspergillus uvarum CBS 121591 TaxID=1448315 RepID=A0A319CDQ1_9EURO|nr:hypothetical protein BO82DRAFT_29062 [Aspergillus uvarum CBS 121591]PYH83936.1 hypothetical protein BO82DRAFT_29062 [Aspergillus uvarum CBS 121591]
MLVWGNIAQVASLPPPAGTIESFMSCAILHAQEEQEQLEGWQCQIQPHSDRKRGCAGIDCKYIVKFSVPARLHLAFFIIVIVIVTFVSPDRIPPPVLRFLALPTRLSGIEQERNRSFFSDNKKKKTKKRRKKKKKGNHRKSNAPGSPCRTARVFHSLVNNFEGFCRLNFALQSVLSSYRQPPTIHPDRFDLSPFARCDHVPPAFPQAAFYLVSASLLPDGPGVR